MEGIGSLGVGDRYSRVLGSAHNHMYLLFGQGVEPDEGAREGGCSDRLPV